MLLFQVTLELCSIPGARLSEVDLTGVAQAEALTKAFQQTIAEEEDEEGGIVFSPIGSVTAKACAMIRYPKVHITGANCSKDLAGVGEE